MQNASQEWGCEPGEEKQKVRAVKKEKLRGNPNGMCVENSQVEFDLLFPKALDVNPLV
jgi:hypothetical protein